MSQPDVAVPERDPRVARTRERVMRAATDLLVEGGPWAVTVDAVVARSGVAKSTIYRHWESRDDLLVEILDCAAPELGPPDPALPTAAALRAIAERVVDVLADPDAGRAVPMLLMLKSQLRGVADVEERMREHQVEIFTDVFERGIREGVLRPDIDPEPAVAQLLGPLIFAHLTGMVPVTHALARSTVDNFLAAYGS